MLIVESKSATLKLQKCKILYQDSQLPGIISKLAFLITDA